MDYKKESLKLHEEKRGKFEIKSKVSIKNKDNLSLAYSPGVAEPCLRIKENKEDVYKYTSKGNLIAVVSDGSAVLGLGNIGPEAALPVMEGKAILFKEFANVDAIPIVLNTQDTEEIIETVKRISPTFGGINLEDISAPRCFEIEERLKAELDIPVFHDDQHGTAIVTLAGIINALKIVEKNISEIKIVMTGAGAAGIAIAKLLISYGAKNIVMVDSKGAIHSGRTDLNKYKKEISEVNLNSETVALVDVIRNADLFIGVSFPNILTKEMVKTMNKDSIIFAMANPDPEIMPDIAKEAGARIVGTGRSDFPNQVNNVLIFPGIFRGALDARVNQITERMKLKAAEAIAKIVQEDGATEDYIIPNAFDKRVAPAVAKAIMDESKEKD
ncbi:MAG: NAD-dependent malic enzyme [Nanoarchaeota archaeon]|nr:NAD-dependent malic enzyme [Nanoarchaeota archaeon]